MDYLDLFLAQNPWQDEQKFSVSPFINRDAFKEALAWLSRDEIITFTGPRQAGKTTILLKTIEYLIQKQKQAPNTIYYFNFDQEEAREEFKKPQQLLSFVQSRSRQKKYWLFLDEVQRLDEAGLYLKILQDLPQKPFKMIISGSSSLLLRAKTKEHLTGRQIEFRVLPLSFKEAAGYYGFKLPANQSQHLRSIQEQIAIYGSYPKPLQENNPQIKQRLLTQLYQDYVKKDVRNYAGVERISEFNKLTALLAYQVGDLINKEELATSAQLDVRTLNKYLEILEETFVIKLLLPYFTRRRREIVKTAKVFFLDNGMRNTRLSNFSKYSLRPDKGKLFENLVLTELIKKLPTNTQVRYWRTQAGAEVDFILVSGMKLTPIEAKATIKRPAITKSFRSFIEQYNPEQAYVISQKLFDNKTYKNTEVSFLPLSRLLDIFKV